MLGCKSAPVQFVTGWVSQPAVCQSVNERVCVYEWIAGNNRKLYDFTSPAIHNGRALNYRFALNIIHNTTTHKHTYLARQRLKERMRIVKHEHWTRKTWMALKLYSWMHRQEPKERSEAVEKWFWKNCRFVNFGEFAGTRWQLLRVVQLTWGITYFRT